MFSAMEDAGKSSWANSGPEYPGQADPLLN